MFTKKHIQTGAAVLAVCALALNAGCFSSAAGPEQETVLEPVAFKPPASADIDQDGDVDAMDLQLFDWVVACDVVRDSELTAADGSAISAAYGQSGAGLAEDTNGDGIVSFADFVLYASMTAFAPYADVDGNGSWNSADRNKIQHSLSGPEG